MTANTTVPTAGTIKPPRAVGLYDPRHEHDSCGVGMVAHLDNRPSHELVMKALQALENLEHRGASGADQSTGDGAGILMQMPDELLRGVVGFELPRLGRYGVLMCFLPQDPMARARLEAMLEQTVDVEGQRVLGWRDVPVCPEYTGRVAGACRPSIRQLFVAAGRDAGSGLAAKPGAAIDADDGEDFDQDAFERKLYVIRRTCELRCEASGDDALYVASSSSRTVNYKGMLISRQLPAFYPDLRDERTKSALALVHSRFSTNTFPSWELAHPYRVICHNGEFNTLMGNVNWMRARESELASELFGEDLAKILPVVRPGNSDSATFDNVLEMLMLAGRSLPHAVMMMIPEAYRNRADLSDQLKGFYDYHACLMEPWDGPAVVAFTDGTIAGATLDRNGLRPGRWVQTRDGYVVLGSEIGLLDIPPGEVERLGRLQPGKLFLVDLAEGRIIEDGETKQRLASRRPYRAWYSSSSVHFSSVERSDQVTLSSEPLHKRRLAFGYTQEDLRVLLTPMARDGEEPVGSMGNDLALAMLSDQAPPLFSYFKQLFAQVTNPPIDPIREEIVMSLATMVGTQRNVFAETPEHAHQLVLDRPILLNWELETLRHISHEVFSAHTIDITWPVERGVEGMAKELARICEEAHREIQKGTNIIILSDRLLSRRRVPIPALLAVSSVHHHLVREGTRLRAGIILESGEPREVHHFATLIGYGASAVNPYVMLETLDELAFEGRIPRKAAKAPAAGANGSSSGNGAGRGAADSAPHPQRLTPAEASQNALKAVCKGLLKTISKMGISTIQSYTGAQIFEAVGLERELVDKHFAGTASRVGGVGLEVLATEALERHARAYPRTDAHRASASSESGGSYDVVLPVGGVYAWRRDGERHIWNPETIALMQQAVRAGNGQVAAAFQGEREAHAGVRESPAYGGFQSYAQMVNEDAARSSTLRGLLQLRTGARKAIPLEEVEPAREIVKRFCTGAMSLGSISREAHETLAIAMNRLQGRSNTGEGGEDPVRFTPDPNGDRRRSAIKQVASGRFGVTVHYLVNADELQIKMAQGAKPGEGGQLPGHKVDEYIGWIRHTTPGVGLISPPPHHDIYSIEDLKQLIYDLRCSNPQAQVSVKLVSEVGVGTVAAGVSKANADRVLISGHDGGTGASPLSSIQAAGVPWEIGLAETQQTLLLNDLRSRIVVQTDGQLKTGRDVVIAALLGADEMGFSTAPLIAAGCIMMRACHLNTCPVGIATQDPELRKRFTGTPEHVVNFFFFLAEEVRDLLASLGLRSLDEAIGRVDLLAAEDAIEHWKARGVDLSHILKHVELPDGTPRHRVEPPPPVLDDAIDWELLEHAKPALRSADGLGEEAEAVPTSTSVDGASDGATPAGRSAPGGDGKGIRGDGAGAGGDGAGTGGAGAGGDGAGAGGDGAAAGGDGAVAGRDRIVAVADSAESFAAATNGRVHLRMPIRNVNRCVGGILSSHIARAYGADGLPADSIHVTFEGSAGQSFGGWLAPGVTFTLFGDTNDYTGKGLSGGVLAVRPPEGVASGFRAEQNVIIGNTVLYGATAGKAFFRGLAGERFAVRNSGAWAVVEGVGDHGCEYMTGGRVVVLGPTGRNFAAGMSGGVAYVLDEDGSFQARCNMGMVGFEAPDEADARELGEMVKEHFQRTGSPVAERVLADWEGLLDRGAFVKVMPHDYKRVLREIAEREQALAEPAASASPAPSSAESAAGAPEPA